MSAQLATADDRLWARECLDRSIRNGSIVPGTASNKPQVGACNSIAERFILATQFSDQKSSVIGSPLFPQNTYLLESDGRRVRSDQTTGF